MILYIDLYFTKLDLIENESLNSLNSREFKQHQKGEKTWERFLFQPIIMVFANAMISSYYKQNAIT